MTVEVLTRKAFFDNKNGIINNNKPVKISQFVPDVSKDITQDLIRCSDNKSVHYMSCASEHKGRYFYNEDLTNFNFEHSEGSLKSFFELLEKQKEKAEKSYFAAQAIPVDVIFKDAMSDILSCEELPNNTDRRLWIGNQCNTAAHFDFSHNIAVVLKGKREFKLFPTNQVNNLYIGPISRTPGGTPISLVDVTNPDYEKFPRYKQAEAESITIELNAGDAVFIPNLWWHSVQSLSDENILLNYWWKETGEAEGAPFESMIFLMSFIPMLSRNERQAWESLFKYFVFQTDHDPKAHMPENLYDILNNLSEQDIQGIKKWFKQKI
ncbi:hypothetical protein N474_02275 [Pseudoalteromonas luteoviolacea CPMOR-2]|uniref:JmjC domain-containing protein n=1 Tax=Pseudoalteromonas luteoviolacea DSM 6061 TaxID=1365250 RepID=A0A166V4V0_9GAMM|nr:cupin-like domain-containing protein [Pseudoalteromonas luteoviolacea]KZN31712.1 hypothetical protein N475_04455 [Pseudoalteromonas luteoviolacea DSM 6061]KZN54572.1 hypothetical protein N474_02275 [Pseudoalteromonas luteoviolacea CPMOR-2]MBE0389049.1 hypothetical protein [Pseudoalteromonas luteoviolacea DSM 6061]